MKTKTAPPYAKNYEPTMFMVVPVVSELGILDASKKKLRRVCMIAVAYPRIVVFTIFLYFLINL